MRYSPITNAEYIKEYTIKAVFKDGTCGMVDLSDCLWGEVFEPLRNPEMFRRFFLDDKAHTLVWENGADIAPEFLYERAKANPI